MAARKGINISRLKTIYRRQEQDRWGPDYVPSILATPQEAPSISRASTLNSGKLGREAHVLSIPERNAALLALYHPSLVELHEQKMLSVGPRVHPLFDFPGVIGIDLPPIKGLIDVAERLGYLKILPRLKIENPDDLGNPRMVVFPYIGDFLLFMGDGRRCPYCINWSVKDTEIAFKRPAPSVGKNLRSHEESQLAIARHEIEEVYHADAGIKTIRVAGEQIHPHVSANLTQLFGYHRNKLALEESHRQEIMGKFRIAMESGIPPMEVMVTLTAQGQVTAHDCRTVLYQAIWFRELRVDLFRPILIDRPLNPEERDVLIEYSSWFEE